MCRCINSWFFSVSYYLLIVDIQTNADLFLFHWHFLTVSNMPPICWNQHRNNTAGVNNQKTESWLWGDTHTEPQTGLIIISTLHYNFSFFLELVISSLLLAFLYYHVWCSLYCINFLYALKFIEFSPFNLPEASRASEWLQSAHLLPKPAVQVGSSGAFRSPFSTWFPNLYCVFQAQFSGLCTLSFPCKITCFD